MSLFKYKDESYCFCSVSKGAAYHAEEGTAYMKDELNQILLQIPPTEREQYIESKLKTKEWVFTTIQDEKTGELVDFIVKNNTTA